MLEARAVGREQRHIDNSGANKRYVRQPDPHASLECADGPLFLCCLQIRSRMDWVKSWVGALSEAASTECPPSPPPDSEACAQQRKYREGLDVFNADHSMTSTIPPEAHGSSLDTQSHALVPGSRSPAAARADTDEQGQFERKVRQPDPHVLLECPDVALLIADRSLPAWIGSNLGWNLCRMPPIPSVLSLHPTQTDARVQLSSIEKITTPPM